MIFDCDGVLIDSERLAVRTEAHILQELGWELSEADVIERFVGRSSSYMRGEIEAHFGHEIDWVELFAKPVRAVFDAELVEICGVRKLLESLRVPVCVASSSTHASIRRNLTHVDLLKYFDDKIYSAQDVINGKPEPDLFLHAAHEMGVDPSRCVVIEDSVSGVTGAKAANMFVYGFTGSVTSEDALRHAGAEVFDSMTDLVNLLSLP